MRRWLVIMAKAPVMGQVKTRLAKDIGLVQATYFYRQTMVQTLCRLEKDPRWTTILSLTPDHEAKTVRWFSEKGRNGLWVCGQGRGDLGQRMRRIFESLPPGPVVIIGADIPGIKPAMIMQAFQRLGDHDGVVGPAEDGGYWLVGAARRKPLPRELFKGVRWSTRHALDDTLSSFVGCKIAKVEQLCDIDRGADFMKLRSQIGRR